MKTAFLASCVLVTCTVVSVALFATAVFYYNRHYAEYELRLPGWAEESSRKPPVAWRPDDPNRVRILAIGGGGLFGLADLQVLQEVEKRSGKQIYELFDFVSGTSTGAIIAALLFSPRAETGVPMTASEAMQAYETGASKVFAAPLYHRILTVNGLFGPRNTNERRIEISEELFGRQTLADMMRPAMVPGFSHATGDLKLFRNWVDSDANLGLAPLLTAVTSVPMVFPSIRLIDADGDHELIGDGAILLNSPGEMAYLEARRSLPSVEEFIVVSLDDDNQSSISETVSTRGGALQWVPPLLGAMVRGESLLSAEILERHGTFISDIELQTLVVDMAMPEGVDIALTPSRENIENIRKAGTDYLEANGHVIDRIVTLLTKDSGNGKAAGR